MAAQQKQTTVHLKKEEKDGGGGLARDRHSLSLSAIATGIMSERSDTLNKEDELLCVTI